MNYHIVRTNESLEKIALIYQLTPLEIRSLNLHIRDWNHLIPGTKLKLPAIPEAVQEELDNVEPFIEDYYPRIDTPFSTATKETATMEKTWEKQSVLQPEADVQQPEIEQVIHIVEAPQAQVKESTEQSTKPTPQVTPYPQLPTNPYYWYYYPYNAYANRYYMDYYRMQNANRKK